MRLKKLQETKTVMTRKNAACSGGGGGGGAAAAAAVAVVVVVLDYLSENPTTFWGSRNPKPCVKKPHELGSSYEQNTGGWDRIRGTSFDVLQGPLA